MELDAGIASVQSNTFAFVSSRLSAIWEVVWGILNKTPPAGQPPATGATGAPAAGAGGQTPSTAPAFNVESAMGLWRTYGPGIMGALSRPTMQTNTSQASVPSPSASSTSLQPNVAPNAELRSTIASPMPSPSLYPNGPTSSQSSVAPPFPEPQHFS